MAPGRGGSTATQGRKKRTPHEIHVAKLIQGVNDKIAKVEEQPYADILDKYLKKWLFAVPGVAVFFSIHALALTRFDIEKPPELDNEDQELEAAIQADKDDADNDLRDSTTSETDDAIWEKLMKTLTPYPEFPMGQTMEMMDAMDSTAFVQFLDMLRLQIRQGRSNDLRNIRKAAPEIILEGKSHRLKEMFTSGGPKSERGFNNHDCARMLVPLKDLEKFDKDPEAFMKAVNKGVDPLYHWKSQFWCTFLYPPNTKYIPGRVNGLFEGFMVARALRIVYFGPSTGLNPSGPITHPPKAAKHRLTAVEPHHVAYVIVLIAVSLSSTAQWKPRIKTFSLRRLYENVIAFLSSGHPRAVKILKKLTDQMPWDRVKYGSASDAEDEADHPDSVANLLANESDSDDDSEPSTSKAPEPSKSSDDDRTQIESPQNDSPPPSPPPSELDDDADKTRGHLSPGGEPLEEPVDETRGQLDLGEEMPMEPVEEMYDQRGPGDELPEEPVSEEDDEFDIVDQVLGYGKSRKAATSGNGPSTANARKAKGVDSLFDDSDDENGQSDNEIPSRTAGPRTPLRTIQPPLKRFAVAVDEEEDGEDSDIQTVQRKRVRSDAPNYKPPSFLHPQSTRPTRSNTILPTKPYSDPPGTVSRRRKNQRS